MDEGELKIAGDEDGDGIRDSQEVGLGGVDRLSHGDLFGRSKGEKQRPSMHAGAVNDLRVLWPTREELSYQVARNQGNLFKASVHKAETGILAVLDFDPIWRTRNLVGAFAAETLEQYSVVASFLVNRFLEGYFQTDPSRIDPQAGVINNTINDVKGKQRSFVKKMDKKAQKGFAEALGKYANQYEEPGGIISKELSPKGISAGFHKVRAAEVGDYVGRFIQKHGVSKDGIVKANGKTFDISTEEGLGNLINHTLRKTKYTVTIPKKEKEESRPDRAKDDDAAPTESDPVVSADGPDGDEYDFGTDAEAAVEAAAGAAAAEAVTEASDTETDGPDTGTDGPDTGTDGPDTETDGPDTETDGPDTETDGPDTGTDGPDTGTDGADAGTDGPDAGTDGPDAGTDGPDTGTDGADAGTDGPDAGTDGPDTGTDGPDTGTDGPDGDEPDRGGDEPDLDDDDPDRGGGGAAIDDNTSAGYELEKGGVKPKKSTATPTKTEIITDMLEEVGMTPAELALILGLSDKLNTDSVDQAKTYGEELERALELSHDITTEKLSYIIGVDPEQVAIDADRKATIDIDGTACSTTTAIICNNENQEKLLGTEKRRKSVLIEDMMTEVGITAKELALILGIDRDKINIDGTSIKVDDDESSEDGPVRLRDYLAERDNDALDNIISNELLIVLAAVHLQKKVIDGQIEKGPVKDKEELLDTVQKKLDQLPGDKKHTIDENLDIHIDGKKAPYKTASILDNVIEYLEAKAEKAQSREVAEEKPAPPSESASKSGWLVGLANLGAAITGFAKKISDGGSAAAAREPDDEGDNAAEQSKSIGGKENGRGTEQRAEETKIAVEEGTVKTVKSIIVVDIVGDKKRLIQAALTTVRKKYQNQAVEVEFADREEEGKGEIIITASEGNTVNIKADVIREIEKIDGVNVESTAEVDTGDGDAETAQEQEVGEAGEKHGMQEAVDAHVEEITEENFRDLILADIIGDKAALARLRELIEEGKRKGDLKKANDIVKEINQKLEETIGKDADIAVVIGTDKNLELRVNGQDLKEVMEKLQQYQEQEAAKLKPDDSGGSSTEQGKTPDDKESKFSVRELVEAFREAVVGHTQKLSALINKLDAINDLSRLREEQRELASQVGLPGGISGGEDVSPTVRARPCDLDDNRADRIRDEEKGPDKNGSKSR